MIGLLTALAGGLGAAVRFLLDTWITHRSSRASLPLGTLLINVTGSLALGFVTSWWTFRTGDVGLKLALGTGFLGGYTTFSTACVEAVRLARGAGGRAALFHAGGMLLLSVAAAALGYALGAA